tara:strand:+ start:295 stop:438 length:144 start_codon:yes stop_codon:yes gene_type:complete
LRYLLADIYKAPLLINKVLFLMQTQLACNDANFNALDATDRIPGLET